MSNRFNLEKAIAAWRRSLEYNPALLREDVDELESHVRDQVRGLVLGGLPEEEAYDRAVRQMGGYGTVEGEYQKVYWGKVRRRRETATEVSRRITMFKNYLKIALRTLRKQKTYAFLNVIGLALGMAACLLLALYVRYQLSFDSFHEDADNIYRVAVMEETSHSRTPHPAALALVQDFAEIESAVSLTPIWDPGLTRPIFSIRYEDRRFDEQEVLAVDSTFLDVFSFPVIQGDAQKALREPFSILITESTARKYFGDANPLGKTLRIDDEFDFHVGAVLADVPANSHFHFDFLISYVTLKQVWQGSPFFTWVDFGHYNYIRLTEGADPASVEARILDWFEQYIPISPEDREAIDAGLIRIVLQPLTDIHLRSNLMWELEPNGSIAYVYLFSAAAVFILLIACINFTNLVTARSAERAKEVGIRKSLGAMRTQLTGQFLAESMLLSLLAAAVAYTLVQISLPLLQAMLGTDLNVRSQAHLMSALLGIAFVTSLLAGVYPALYLSRFHPASVLKGQMSVGRERTTLRKSLVVTQFTLSILLIIGTLVIYQQVTYLRSHTLGFQSAQVVVLPLKDDGMQERYEAVKAALKENPGILAASAVSNVPGGRFNQNDIAWGGRSAPVSELRVDHDFFATLGIEMAEGREFSREYPSDVASTFILNETAARQFDRDNPIGEEVVWYGDEGMRRGTVIGVAKDFHFESLHQGIAPLIIQILPEEFNYLLVRIRPEEIGATLAALEETWTVFDPGHTFEYSFLDQDFEALYDIEQRMGTLAAVFAALAIIIACLGLFGLATFATQRRTKEIGVRKVLGASVSHVVFLLTSDFLRLVLLAFIVAVPAAYLAASRWLENFAYHAPIGLLHFLTAGVLVLAVAFATVGYQAFRAALADPVKSLRYE
jgi:putative ABC transport system permease protein